MKRTLQHSIKGIIGTILLAAVSFTAKSQGFEYYGSVTNADGSPSVAEAIDLVFEIKGSDGNVVYGETHKNLKTDANGMFHAIVGNGEKTAGDFSQIPWEEDDIEISVEYVREDGSKTLQNETIGHVPLSFGAESTDALVSREKDGSKYFLKVDDSGNLSTSLRDTGIISIPDGYSKILFHDEFNTDGMVDEKYWSYEEGSPRNGEMQYYTVRRPENVRIEDGYLKIVTLNDNWTDENGTVHPVTSGSIITKDKVAFTYGRVDVRAKLPICLGSWPAIWMMPNDNLYGYWPNSGEIDIMEHVGFNPYTVYFTAHCAEQNGNDNKYHNSASVPTCTTEFHIYSLEWSENRLDWFVDGKRRWTVVKNSNTWRGWPFNQDFYFQLNTAFGGSWGAQRGVDLEALPITYEIDYVRIFQ